MKKVLGAFVVISFIFSFLPAGAINDSSVIKKVIPKETNISPEKSELFSQDYKEPIKKVWSEDEDGYEQEEEIEKKEELINKSIIKNINVKEITSLKKISQCVVDNRLLEKVDEITREIKKAKEEGEQDIVESLYQELEEVKKEIEKKKAECARLTEKGQQQKPIEKLSLPFDPCEEIKKIEEKEEYYKKLLSLSAEELRAKGYLSEEEINKILSELNKKYEELKKACSNPTGAIVSPIIIKPVVPSEADEIVSYYKEKMNEIISQEMGSEAQIESLTNLRSEIDEMIRELMRQKSKVEYSHISPVVKEISLEPGNISAGKVDLKVTTRKKIEVPFKGKKVAVKVDKKSVKLEENGIQAFVSSAVKIQEGKLIVGDKEIKITPEEVINKTKVSPFASVEVMIQENKPVYRLKEVENKRILGLIPVTFSREVIVDASDSAGKIIEDNKPWWSFLAF
ncbi:hypothetical protein J7K24_01500 [bacterium]|nr:hypothetical protein [bacterium]